MYMRIALVILVAACFGSIVHAQPVNWYSTGMGGGGAFFSPSISPHNPAHLYVASDMSDLFHSTDRGATWSTVDYRVIQAGNIYGKVQFTNNPSVQYALDNTGEQPHPVKTSDAGQAWTANIVDPTNGGAFTLIADHENANIVLVSDYTKLYVSVNGGNTFSVQDTSAAPSGYLLAGACFNGQTICVGTNHGLLISTDGGNVFARTNIPGIPPNETIVSLTGAASGLTARLFCVTASTSNTYAGMTGSEYGSYTGMYSLDLPLAPTWIPCGATIPTSVKPFFVSMCPTNINVAYVAGGSTVSAPTVYKTTNGGLTWSSCLATTSNGNVATGWSGDGGDRGWSYGEYALGFTVSTADVNTLMFTDLGFVYYSSNGGAQWKQVYCSTADQNPISQPTPVGKAYHGIGLENTTNWRVAWIDSLKIIGCFSDMRGVRSTDGGASWSQDYTGHTLNSMYYAVYSPAKLNCYAATSSVHDMFQSTTIYDSRIDGGTGMVLYSTDNGHAWRTLHDFEHPVVWLALDPANSNRMYASVVSSTAGGIYVCSDIQNGGTSVWTKLTAPPRTEGHAFNILVLNDGSLLCTFSARRPSASVPFTASSGVFYSTNRGASWMDRSDVGMQYYTKDVVVDPHDPAQKTWYAGVFSNWSTPPNTAGGFYRTTDRGVTWTKISSLRAVTSCTVHPDDPNIMYMTTETDGLQYTTNLTAATPTFSAVPGYPFRQPERVFFNPFDHRDVWVSSFGNGMRHSGSNVPLPPAAPELLDPTNTEAGVLIRDTLHWSAVAGATSYHVQVAHDSLFTNRVIDSSNIGAPRLVLSGMAYNTRYWWRVTASGPSGTGGWSETWSFSIERLTLQEPFKVILETPINAAVINVPPNRFTWHPTQPQVDRYALEISADSLFATSQVDTSITDTLKDISAWTIAQTGRHWWRIRAHNLAGWGIYSDVWLYTVTETGVEEPLLPASATLEQNVPNPFIDQTTLRFSLTQRTLVSLNVYDALGAEVGSPFVGTMNAGAHVMPFTAHSLPTGMYFMRLTTPAGSQIKPMMRVK